MQQRLASSTSVPFTRHFLFNMYDNFWAHRVIVSPTCILKDV